MLDAIDALGVSRHPRAHDVPRLHSSVLLDHSHILAGEATTKLPRFGLSLAVSP
jgi:hypothetical protein